MSRKIKGNGKHLTFSDRVYIEQELMQGSSFREIAAGLGKDPSTACRMKTIPSILNRAPHSLASAVNLGLLIS